MGLFSNALLGIIWNGEIAGRQARGNEFAKKGNPMDLHQLAKELRERQICQERWKDCEMSEADFRKIVLEMPDERMVLTYCACPGGGEDHVPRDLGLAAVRVAESAEEWLEITSQIGPNGELLPRPEPQKFQFSRAKVLALLGQHRQYMFKKRGKTAGHT